MRAPLPHLPWEAIADNLASAQPIRLSGRVVRVGGLLVEGVLPGARMGMICRLGIRGYPEGVPAEIVALREGRVSLMPLQAVPGIRVGTPIEPFQVESSVGVSDAMIGRVLDGWGHPIDKPGGSRRIRAVQRYPLYPLPMNPLERGLVDSTLPVGVRSLDAMLTCGEGQRLVIMAGAGVGKSTLLGMMARNSDADVTVVALIGERSREVKRFVESELGRDGLARSIVISSTSNTAVALRLRAAFVATAIAEYFRDQGKRVLLLMDSLTRVCMAQRELGLATGEPPTTRGYPPSAFAIIPRLLERAGPGSNERGGSITALYTALLESDDLGDPIGDAIRAVTDGHIVLSRRLADRGHFPAIDVLKSVSRVMSEVVSEDHRKAAAVVRRTMADLEEVDDLLSIGGYDRGAVPRFERALEMSDALRAFLRQSSEEPVPTADDTCRRLFALAQRVREAEGAAG